MGQLVNVRKGLAAGVRADSGEPSQEKGGFDLTLPLPLHLPVSCPLSF